MIKIDRVSKAFGSVPVLQDISFEIEPGDFTAVMGPSGSGKSTLLYSISGMDSISDGEVWFENTNIAALSEVDLARFRLTQMGFVFQSAQMLKNLTIFDNITLPGLVAKIESPEVIQERARELMRKMDIEAMEGRDIREVSGGQLQRAAICRAMINNPAILFLDEPTGALNSAATDRVLAILQDLNAEGMTILTVTHDSRVAARAKRIIYIMDGKLAGSKQFAPGVDREGELELWLQDFRKFDAAHTEWGR